MCNLIYKTKNQSVCISDNVSETDINIISHILQWDNPQLIQLHDDSYKPLFRQIDSILYKTFDFSSVKNTFKTSIDQIDNHFPSFNEHGICEICNYRYELPSYLD